MNRLFTIKIFKSYRMIGIMFMRPLLQSLRNTINMRLSGINFFLIIPILKVMVELMLGKVR